MGNLASSNSNTSSSSLAYSASSSDCFPKQNLSLSTFSLTRTGLSVEEPKAKGISAFQFYTANRRKELVRQ
ncbi:hypothetical protein QYF36_020859 [Acer negundo]|nr:hypothetical protein QYF36_020859 [Acer negundo]